jgi:F-type H+-transporting ATPase subunit epsilon
MSNKNKKAITLSVVTPIGEIFDGEVKSVVLPGVEGEFGVLPEHSSLVTMLSKGIVTITYENSKTENIVIDWGYCEVGDNKVYILANGAVSLNENSEIANSLKKATTLIDEAKSDYTTYSTISYLKQEISNSSH